MFSRNATERATGSLSLKEAAVLASVTEKQIRHELAAKVIRPFRKANHRVLLDPNVVFFLYLVAHLPIDLPKSDRRELFELLTHRDSARGNWAWKAGNLIRTGKIPIEVSTAEAKREVAGRLAAFARGRKRVHRSPEILGNEPVFKGTRVSVRHVGLLAKRGIPEAALVEDFPSLTRDDIVFARMFVELGRPPGRPRKLKLVRQ